MSRKLSRICTLAAAGFVAGYFLYFTIGSLLTEFTHDDLMNCYRGWFYPLPQLIADNVLFFRFTPMYRPFGALVYKAFFGPFGFDLFPLRILILATLAGNILLVYKLCRILTDSVEVGLFAALLSAYHAKFGQLYYNTGTIYDIFCFLFYFAALVFYIGIRHKERNVSAVQGAAICVLYILALNSKELAVSLPLTLLGYELLWHRPAFEKQALWNWLTRRTWVVWATAPITAAFVLGRVLFQEQGISNIGDYTMTVSAGEYLRKVAFYLGEVFYSPDWFSSLTAFLVVITLLAVGAAGRSRTLLFGTLLFSGGILPMAFIHARALSAVYVPLAGLAVCAAVLLGFLCDGLRRASQRPEWQPLAFWVVFGALGFLMVRLQPDDEHYYVALDTEFSQIRDAREQLQRLHPDFPGGSRILILGTPFPQYSPGHNNLFMIRLAYRDESLEVQELARLRENHQPLIPSDYDYILSYKDGHWVDVDPATLSAGDNTRPSSQ